MRIDLCRLFGHHRSREFATWEGKVLRSYCRRCGHPMQKTRDGEWIAVDEEAPEPRE